MMNIAPDAAWRVTAQTAKVVRLRSIGFVNMSTKPTPLLDSFSFSMALRISAASASTSVPSGRSHANDLSPSSYLPCRINQRGDSGMNGIVIMMKNGTT